MIRRRMSVDSDGCQNGDRRYGFRQSRVPGAEANLTTILRNFHNPRVLTFASPSDTPLRLLYGLFSRLEARRTSRYLSRLSREYTTRHHRTHPPLHFMLFHSYPQHVRPASLAFSSHYIASDSFISFPYTALLTCFHTSIRFDTLRLPPHAATIIPSCIVFLAFRLPCS